MGRGGGWGSYRPTAPAVPATIHEHKTGIVISIEHVVELTLQTRVPSGAGYRHKYAGGEQRPIDLGYIPQSESTSHRWPIRVFPVETYGDNEPAINEA
jgi:hypothetical protein